MFGNIASFDACEIKTMTVDVQENGIIRNSKGYIIGRLSPDMEFDSEHVVGEHPNKMQITITELVKDVQRLANENVKLKLQKFTHFAGDECWIYSEGEDNHLESLVCPVVINPSTLKTLLEDNKQA